MPALISLNNLTLQYTGQKLLHDIAFQLRSGECWAVTGPTGSGKTIFLQTLAGQFALPPGTWSSQQRAAFVSFKEESRQFSYSGHFYQQRYQATMSDDAPTLHDFLGFTDSLENRALVERLGLTPLLNTSLLKLSNGQTRKARIGHALLRHPAILLLDNPFVGLDAAFRAELTNWLGELTKYGLTLMLVADPADIPPFATHVVALNGGRIQWMGAKGNYRPEPSIAMASLLPILQTPAQAADFTEAFQLRDVTVRYGDTVILNRINWTVRSGERWALLGPNGAGKSVLLSMLYGDHPQAYANDVRVFGYRRGRAGESIWDVKRRIGFVSPELHLYFPQHLSARQVALTGLTDTMNPPKRTRPETEADLHQLLDYFDIADVSDRPFGSLSAGEQRLVLLVRALLKNPPVLLLDEPFQAIDTRRIGLARQLLERYTDKTMLFITHDPNELPAHINQTFVLSTGRTA